MFGNPTYSDGVTTQPFRVPELMDRPDADPVELARSLRDLERVNRWLRGGGIAVGLVWRIAERVPDRPVCVLDVGTGDAIILDMGTREIVIDGGNSARVLAEYAARLPAELKASPRRTKIVIREIEKDDENLRLLRQEISSQRGSTYFARMQYGRLVDSLLQQRSEQLVNDIFNTLGSVSVASRANKPIGEKMILNAAFLVARDREGDFDTKVKEIDARYENLKFKYTGPWPPYNFVNIRLKLERAAEAE